MTYRVRAATVAAMLAACALSVAACAGEPPDARDFCALYSTDVAGDPTERAEAVVAIEALLSSEFGKAHADLLERWSAMRKAAIGTGSNDLATLDELSELHRANCGVGEEGEEIEQEQLDEQVDD